MSAEGLCRAVAILIVGTGVGLAVGSANAETTAVEELKASDGADSGFRDPAPTAPDTERRREQSEQRELTPKRQEEWWTHAHEVLFGGIELSPEQSRGVDAIIEAQLEDGRRSGELRAELETARQQGDTERIRAIRAEGRPLRARREGPHECMEEMRALLSKEQHPTFDMNRAHLAAEGQQPKKKRRERNRLPRVEVKAE